ncbi:MAG TPA: thioredoxin domain-containing protein [Gaiellaceae bacterium]|nr:thioredoxin domain-containing protein [Gaiellaceae bacterium]
MKNLLQGRNLLLVVGAAAIVVAVPLILISVLGGGSGSAEPAPTTTADTGSAPGAPARAPGAAEAAKLFAGIPQQLNQLGNPNAKVTLIEFADPQCPFCREFELDVLPTVLADYVRTGKVKMVVFGIQVIGPNSETGLRAMYAAGLQGKLWNVLELLYKSQGAENSGWISDELLRRIGASIPRFDTAKMIADLHSAEVDAALAASEQQATNAQVRATPTFFAGTTGGTLQQLPITALTPDEFRSKLDPLVR